MEQNNNYNFNSAKIYTGTSCGELRVSTPHSKSVISATNNKAKYYAELSEKYKDEARKYKDEAKTYAEKNADVTIENLEELELSLQKEIALKQPLGDYALKKELPQNVSELNNDAEYVISSELNATVEELKLPNQEEQNGKFLTTDGENTHWTGINSFNLFDTKLTDRILTYEETKGWALQGTYVYKEALAGSHYGYPTFYEECLAQKASATSTEITLGENTINIYVHSNGHQFYDISDKEFIDSWFNTYGTAWFYGIDTENERVFLPRNNWFEQATGNISEVGLGVEAGLPNITGSTGDNDVLMRFWRLSGAFNRTTSATANLWGTGTANAGRFEFDASLSNPIYGNSDTVQPNSVKKLLYICVGNTVNYEGITNVVNQGIDILEQVNQGIESRIMTDGSNAEFPYITETYQNQTSWYRVYSDGWCEQGGLSSTSFTASSTSTETITLLKPYKDTNYTASVNKVTTTTGSSHTVSYSITSNSQLVLNNNSSVAGKISWRACGYIA